MLGEHCSHPSCDMRLLSNAAHLNLTPTSFLRLRFSIPSAQAWSLSTRTATLFDWYTTQPRNTSPETVHSPTVNARSLRPVSHICLSTHLVPEFAPAITILRTV